MDILDLIDNAIDADGDAMRWAPELVAARRHFPDLTEEVRLAREADPQLGVEQWWADQRLIYLYAVPPDVRATTLTYQVERPDGTVIYVQTISSVSSIDGINLCADGALRIGALDMIHPPWRMRLYADGEWETLAEENG